LREQFHHLNMCEIVARRFVVFDVPSAKLILLSFVFYFFTLLGFSSFEFCDLRMYNPEYILKSISLLKKDVIFGLFNLKGIFEPFV